LIIFGIKYSKEIIYLFKILLIMKKIILSILAIGIGLYAFAQEAAKEGEITYEETMKIEINFEGMTDRMREMMPSERKSKKILYFNEEASSYQSSKEEVDGTVPGAGHRGMGMRFMMSSPDNKVYMNYKNNLKIEQREFMSRTFLIKGEPAKDNWKLTANQKMVLNYPCQEAVQITEKDTISAWFTPVIPVSAGPGNYVNLPGLVLEVNIYNGKRVITAQNIDLKAIDKKLIAKPKKGKKVTNEEFEKIVAEKTKEMGEQGGERRIIMRMHR
jgi:GLPGLI family protein